jgi:hypothetical protein
MILAAARLFGDLVSLVTALRVGLRELAHVARFHEAVDHGLVVEAHRPRQGAGVAADDVVFVPHGPSTCSP